ncbi:MAG TPA: hypothetical protein VIN35_14455 [Hydrogenophaga sp.]
MKEGDVDHIDAGVQRGQIQNGVLVVHCPGQVWMSIRPIQPLEAPLSPDLLRLVGRVVAPADIKALLPDWASLKWERIPPGDFSNGEWVIYGNGYRVNVYGEPGASSFHHEVMQQVVAFLRGGVGTGA